MAPPEVSDEEKRQYDEYVRSNTVYAGVFFDVKIYPVRIVKVCELCKGAGQARFTPGGWGRCPACKGKGQDR